MRYLSYTYRLICWYNLSLCMWKGRVQGALLQLLLVPTKQNALAGRCVKCYVTHLSNYKKLLQNARLRLWQPGHRKQVAGHPHMLNSPRMHNTVHSIIIKHSVNDIYFKHLHCSTTLSIIFAPLPSPWLLIHNYSRHSIAPCTLVLHHHNDLLQRNIGQSRHRLRLAMS